MIRYTSLEVRRVFRDRRFVFFTVVVPVLFYLLWSNVFAGDSGDEPSTGLAPKLYLMVAMACYGALGAALTTTGARLAQERQGGWLRQLQVTPLRPWAVIGAKVIASVLLALPAVALVSLTALVGQHVRLAPWEWVAVIVAIWLGTIPFAALGTLIGSLMSADAAQPVTLICYFGLSILGGLWLPTAQLPGALRHLAGWLPSHSFAELGWRIAGGHAPAASDGLTLAGWTVVLGALAVLAYRRATVRT